MPCDHSPEQAFDQEPGLVEEERLQIRLPPVDRLPEGIADRQRAGKARDPLDDPDQRMHHAADRDDPAQGEQDGTQTSAVPRVQERDRQERRDEQQRAGDRVREWAAGALPVSSGAGAGKACPLRVPYQVSLLHQPDLPKIAAGVLTSC